MSEPDPMMQRIGEGVTLSQQGERAAARQLFAQLWDELGVSGDPVHRCALAHYMADSQEDVEHELRWDLRALEAADLATDDQAERAGAAGPVAGFYPSLHLNIAECYRKLGDLDKAHEHLDRGDAAAGALGDDGYGEMIKGGLARLSERLAAGAKRAN